MPMTDKLPPFVIDTFEIPDEMARELDKLITQVSVLKDIMVASADNTSGFEKLEARLIPLQARYTSLKNSITYYHVPEKYQNDTYSWVFPGYDMVGPVCWIEKTGSVYGG